MMSDALRIDAKTTALVAIDLQKGIVGRQGQPYPTSQVVDNSVKIADALRNAGGLVVWVHVNLSDMLSLPADEPSRAPGSPPPPPEASEFVPQLNMQPGDVRVTKRQWGAFYGTNLEQDLRRRGIKTIIMTGIATHIGVESTARAAFDHGYALVFAEDAMTTMSAAAHEFPIKHVFPRMGHVRSTVQILSALK